MCTTYEEIKMCLTQEKCIREQTNRSISIGILSLIDTVDSKCYLTRIFRPLISANCFTDKEMNPNIKKSMCLQKIKRRNKDGYYGVQNMNDFPEKIGKFVSDITQIKLNSCVVSGGDTLEVTSSIENKNIVLIGNLFYDFVASLLRIYLLILQSMFATHTMEIFNTVVTLESSDQFSVKKFLSEKSTGHSIESVFLKSQLDTNSLTELVLKRIFKFGSPYNLDANHVKAIITDQINAKAYSRLKSKKRLSKDISDDESEMFGTADCGFDYKFKRTSDTDCCTFTTNKISDYNYTMTDESEMLQSLQNFSHNTSSHDFFTECNLTENKSDALDDESWMTIFEINTEIDISPPASSELNENFGGIREDIQSKLIETISFSTQNERELSTVTFEWEGLYPTLKECYEENELNDFYLDLVTRSDAAREFLQILMCNRNHPSSENSPVKCSPLHQYLRMFIARKSMSI